MRREFFAFLLAVFLAFLSIPAAAQLGQDPGMPTSMQGRIMIVGQVTAAGSNAPLDHVQIYLRKPSGEVIAKSLTNATGTFMVQGVFRDYYIVAAEREGLQPVDEDLDATYSFGTATVTIVMLPVTVGATAPSGTVSARMLGVSERAMEAYKKGLAELHDKKNPEASLPYFQRALKEAPGFCEAHFQSGLAFSALGRNEQAESAFRKSIELCKERFLGARFRLAAVLVDLKKYSEAESMAHEGLAARPESWLGNFELGRALIGLGRQDEAETSIRKAVKLNPALDKGYLLLANIHMARKEPAAVVQDLDDYLRVDPQGPQSDQARRVRQQMQRQVDQTKSASPSLPSPPR